jgi:tetratricopeptide (TPR) repeat protein
MRSSERCGGRPARAAAAFFSGLGTPIGLAVAVLALLISGCSASHALRGADAEKAKDYAAARAEYRLELDSALGEDQAAVVARYRVLLATYELGRMTGYCGDYAEAERLLREALRLSELIEERFSHRTAILSELARLTFDREKPAESVAFYERAIERLDRFEHVDRDPIGFANYLDDYAAALEQTGRPEKATGVRNRADSIRSENVGARAVFTPRHYRDARGQPRRNAAIGV